MRHLTVFVSLFVLFLLAPRARAEVIYSKEDRATVRVMAVSGVVRQRVTPPESANRTKPVTIAIAEAGHGSGVLLSPDGIIATAQHVVDDAEFIAVKIPGKNEALMARVIYENKKHDVAFLKVSGTFADFIEVPETAPMLVVRQQVYALGYPIDGTRKFPQSTAGVVAGTMHSGELQLGISANPGNSGGPLIDDQGNLVGLVIRSSDTTAGYQGLAVAVPVDVVKKYYEHRVLGSSVLARSQNQKADSGAAEVVARIAAINSIGAAISHIEEADGKMRAALLSAEKSQASSADFLALLAGHYWNESIIRYTMDGRNWKPSQQLSSVFARRAYRLDPTIVRRSPFLHSVLGKQLAPKNADKMTHSAPRTMAGFRMGWSIDEARDACTIENLTFSKTTAGYRCAKPPTTDDLTGPVELYFCKDRLCRIDVIDRPSRALSRVWVTEFKDRYAILKKRYGTYDAKDLRLPTACRDNLLSCLEKGTTRLIYRWSWDGRKLTLTLGRLNGKPTMRLSLADDRNSKRK